MCVYNTFLSQSGEILSVLVRKSAGFITESWLRRFIHDHIENTPPLVSLFHSIRTPTSENPTKHRKKSKEKLLNRSVLCTCDTLPGGTTAVFAANAASAAASCSAFKASNSLTTFSSPGIWHVLDLLSLRTKSSRPCWLPISRGGR